MTQRVWGYVYDNDAALAAYFVEGTPRHVEQAANLDLIVGRWDKRVGQGCYCTRVPLSE